MTAPLRIGMCVALLGLASAAAAGTAETPAAPKPTVSFPALPALPHAPRPDAPRPDASRPDASRSPAAGKPVADRPLDPAHIRSASAERGKTPVPSPVGDVPAAKRKAVVLVCDGDVDPGLADWIRTETEAAIKDGATHIIYQIDTYGGLVISAIEITDFIVKEVNPRVHTVAYVPDKAISAGSMMALSCRDLWVGPNAKVGDSAPIIMGGELKGVEREKSESMLRAHFKTLATANGYPVLPAERMVTGDKAVWQVVNRKAGRAEFFADGELPTDAEVYELAGKRKVVGENRLLTLTAAEAVDFGFAEGIAKDADAVAAAYGITSVARTEEAPDRKDFTTLQMIESWNNPVGLAVLLAVGIIALLVGIHTGGLQSLIVGVGAFALFFWVKHSVGDAEGWEIALALAGIAAVLIEFLVFPTGGPLLAGGAAAFLAGVVLCFLPPIALGDMFPASGPETPSLGEALRWEHFLAGLRQAVISMSVGLVLASAGAALIFRFLPHLPFLGKTVLAVSETEIRGAGAAAPLSDMVKVGELGDAETALRPVGKARFGERLLDVVADGTFLDRGDRIRVIAADGNRILVRKVG